MNFLRAVKCIILYSLCSTVRVVVKMTVLSLHVNNNCKLLVVNL